MSNLKILQQFMQTLFVLTLLSFLHQSLKSTLFIYLFVKFCSYQQARIVAAAVSCDTSFMNIFLLEIYCRNRPSVLFKMRLLAGKKFTRVCMNYLKLNVVVCFSPCMCGFSWPLLKLYIFIHFLVLLYNVNWFQNYVSVFRRAFLKITF